MAYSSAQFSKVQNLNPADSDNPSRGLFHYEGAADSIATIKAAGYFNSARDLLTVGDRIMVVGGTNGQAVLLHVATVPATGNVTVTEIANAASGFRVARGQHTTVDENDTIVTGLTTVSVVVASLDDDPVDGCMHATASIGDQAGAPAAGSILIKTWKSTDGDATLIAATTFGKKVGWIAFGA